MQYNSQNRTFDFKPTLTDTQVLEFCRQGYIILDGVVPKEINEKVKSFAKKNFKYILLNNNSHDSVGGQCTYSEKINFEKLSKSLGFKKFYTIYNKKNIKEKIKSFLKVNSASFLEVKISNSKIKNLPRPKDLIKIKNEFIK